MTVRAAVLALAVLSFPAVSGGGNPSYWTGLRHPDLFTHISTRGGNFAIQQVPRDEKVLAAGRQRQSITIFYGDNDHPLILGENGSPGQAQLAHDALTKAGYEKVEIRKIAGMGHQSRPELAAEWFAADLQESKRRFVAGDQADALLENAKLALGKGRHRDAIRELQRLAALESKEGLEPRAEAELAAVNAVGQRLLAEVRTLRDGGDPRKALREVEKLARDFKGLPVEEEAKALRDAWNE